MARLKDMYNETIVDAMTRKFGYKNIMEVPKLDKIVINMGIGEAKENPKVLENAVSDYYRSESSPHQGKEVRGKFQNT